MGRSARDIAGYRLVAGLGEGGMARVYLALSKRAAGFSKLVVLKVLRSATTEDPSMRRMFLDEARVAALLNHPNVVQTYEAGDDEGRLFLAMEYLEGRSLSALLAARPPGEIPLDVHLRILSDTLEGLHYAHDVADVDGTPLDIVHRDVSPQNVLVTFAGQSKVVDFGIAKIAGSPATQSGVIKGKTGYMAPEQIHNEGVDRRADVFAAGVMLWEALARRRLVLRGEPEAAVLARRMSGGEPSVRRFAAPGTAEELLAICDRAMSPSLDDRYATALEMHDAIHGFLQRTGGADAKRVAGVLEAIFGDERRKTRAFVEEQLRVADESSPLIDISKHRPIHPPSLPPPLVPLAPPSAPAAPFPASTRSSLPSVHPRTALTQVTDVMPAPARSNVVPIVIIACIALAGSGALAIAASMRTPAAPTLSFSPLPPPATVSVAPAEPVSAPAIEEPAPPAESARPPAPARPDAGAGRRKKRAIDDGDPYRR